jgi:kanamycin kinase
MKRTLITPSLDDFPAVFHPLLKGVTIFDSSCSPEARVWFIDAKEGLYLKSAAVGSLAREAAMTRFFHEKRLGTEVLDYRTEDGHDWLLTLRVPGEDCTHADYVSTPERLCDLTATLLRELHECDTAGCPIPDHTARYLARAEHNYRNGIYDTSLFPDNWGYDSASEAWQVIQSEGYRLQTDSLLHGDYCLPNIMLDNWKFSRFIDVGDGGVGDRHVDLFWGAWSLFFNLKTDCYRDRFFDAYGRDKIDLDMLRVVAACEVFG